METSRGFELNLVEQHESDIDRRQSRVGSWRPYVFALPIESSRSAIASHASFEGVYVNAQRSDQRLVQLHMP